MFFAFERTADAVAAAVAAQVAHTENDWAIDAEAPRVRIGIHRGTAIEAMGTWLGLAVHQTARTCAAGHGGQVLLSSAAADDLLGPQPPADVEADPEVDLLDLGEFELRDIPGRQRLLQVRHPQLMASFPSPRTKSAARTNLPNQRTTFVGRLRERDEVARLAVPGRLVSVVGPGGAGKTRLSLEVAGHIGPAFADGAWLIELAGLSRGDDLDAFLVSALRELGVVGEAHGPATELRPYVLSALAERQAVVVFDNCEHVIDAVACFVDELLAAAPRVAVLATSREPLAVLGELVWRIPVLDETNATRLFLDRLAQFDAASVEAGRDLGAVRELCGRLDGLPLAVELAASRAATMGVADLAKSLDRRLHALAGGPRAADPRQRSLHALIDWSYELLDPAERAGLRSLSVLPASFSLDVAMAVMPGADQLTVLDGLVRKSLVVAEALDGGPSRYRLLETVRAFAAEHLDGRGERAETNQRLAEGAVDLLADAIPKLSGPDQAAWLDRLDADLPSFRAAMEWCLTTAPTTALALAAPLGQVLGTRGAVVEGRWWAERAVALAPVEPTRPLAQVLAAAGTLSRMQGDLASARAHHERQLEVSRALGGDELVAGALSALGNVLVLQHDLAQAAEAFETSYHLRLGLSDEVGIMRSLNNLGVLAGLLGRADDAARYYEELLERARTRGDTRVIGQTLHNLADLCADAGHLDGAATLLDEAAVHLRSVGDKRSLGITGGLRAAVARRMGLTAEALTRGVAALDHLVDVGDPVAVGLVVDGVAAALVEAGTEPACYDAAVLLAATAELPGGSAEQGLTEEGIAATAGARLPELLGADAMRRAAAEGGGLDLAALIARARSAAQQASG